MFKKNFLKIAYDFIKKNKSVDFSILWSYVAKEMNFDDVEKKNQLSNFYNQLSLDGRFVTFGDNKWFLRDYLTHDKVDDFLYDEKNDDNFNENENFNEKNDEIFKNEESEE